MMKNRFKKGKHRKFQDDWEKSHEPVVEGVTFFVKYLGVEIVNLPNDETHTSEAIKKIIHRAKYGSGKVRKVALTVTPTSLKPTDLETNEELEEIVIHRISYCTADKNNDKIFGFISCHFRTEVLECHAYLCQKRKVAEALALTVAQAFNLAFDVWKKSRVEKTSTGSEEKDESTSDDCGELSDTVLTVQCDTSVISSSAPPSTVTFEKHRPQPLVFNSHIHLEDSNKHAHQVANSCSHIGVEDDPDLDDCFSKLAESRSNPGLLDINVRRSQFDADVIVHFSGTNMDRDTLLKSQSKDSFFLPESQDNLIVGDL
ncbi:low density lipoprotein receptor adapter protein 1-B isoform X2 [Strongylocentrotus purpuratus]|uniref:PID domain-containing protein n=1 Tax=Strongylocentrotus purpuratus TaxID=7668 RepID=A0A7M7PGK9_STRPU|nr:low density lipoprotein receptor adapter protein 1-B isoform X2 [Strongylocentrotus purpuratus]